MTNKWAVYTAWIHWTKDSHPGQCGIGPQKILQDRTIRHVRFHHAPGKGTQF